jgi:hypothetical protein
MKLFQKFSCAIWITLAGFMAFSEQDSAQTSAKCAAPQSATDSEFSPGQVWSYKTREGEGSSTITILRVETLPKLGTIIHIRINGINLKNCSGGPSPHVIEHAPFSKDAIDKSVLKLIAQKETLPNYEAGYSDWRAHCGGVYTISVADMVAADEQTLNAGMNCH